VALRIEKKINLYYGEEYTKIFYLQDFRLLKFVKSTFRVDAVV